MGRQSSLQPCFGAGGGGGKSVPGVGVVVAVAAAETMGDGWAVFAASLSSVFKRRSALMAYHPCAAIDYL